MEMKILDISYLKNHPTEKGYTVKEVLEEALSENFMKSTGNVKILPVEKEHINKVKETAQEIGVFYQLSKADLKLLALAYKFRDKCILLTNDFYIQNLCYFLGITFKGDITIKKAIIYRYYCERCNKIGNIPICSVCGGLCRRFIYKEIDLKTNQS